MLIVMGIGFSLMLLVAFGTMAFWVEDKEPPQLASKTTSPTAQIFFQPTGWSATGKEVSVEQIVADIETHLAQEHSAAAAFARNPSARSLWITDQGDKAS